MNAITPARLTATAPFATPEVDADLNKLEIFTKIPPYHYIGIVAVEQNGTLLKAGEVAVYDTSTVCSEGWIDGALYAVEHQNPRAGMSWEMWWDYGEKYGGRSAIVTSRSVRLLKRHPKMPDHWVLHPIAPRDALGCYMMSDGPIPQWLLGERLLGRIIGIYNPAPLGGSNG